MDRDREQMIEELLEHYHCKLMDMDDESLHYEYREVIGADESC